MRGYSIWEYHEITKKEEMDLGASELIRKLLPTHGGTSIDKVIYVDFSDMDHIITSTFRVDVLVNLVKSH